MDMNESYQWQEGAGLKDSTEALIVAAWGQALSTRATEAQIFHNRPTSKVVENEILWDFQIQTDKMVMANQPDTVIIDKQQRKAIMSHQPNDGNIRKKEHEKMEKWARKTWRKPGRGRQATVVSMVIGALGPGEVT